MTFNERQCDYLVQIEHGSDYIW